MDPFILPSCNYPRFCMRSHHGVTKYACFWCVYVCVSFSPSQYKPYLQSEVAKLLEGCSPWNNFTVFNKFFCMLRIIMQVNWTSEGIALAQNRQMKGRKRSTEFHPSLDDQRSKLFSFE